MKTIMPDLVGNRALAKKLGEELLSSGISHAYIIGGAKGSGRHTLARLIAASIACENKENGALPLPCHRCENCRKIFSGISPDINVIGLGDKATIGVETVRELKLDVLKAPNDLEVKVYIIEDADKMTHAAQNAFLLTLEEPPPYILFLLLCERPEDMLETVRSRAPVFRTEPLSAECIDEYISKDETVANLKNTSPDEFYEIIMASDGRIGRALELCSPDKRAEIIKARGHAKRFISAMSGRPSGTALLDIIEEFPAKSRPELLRRIDLITSALRDLIVLKKSEDAPLCFYHDREAAIELSDLFTVSSLLSLISACEDARNAILRNANVKLTITNLVMKGNYGK